MMASPAARAMPTSLVSAVSETVIDIGVRLVYLHREAIEMRTLAAVLAGLMTALVVITLVEAVGHTFMPPPEGHDPMTPEGMSAIVAQMSPAALLFVLLAYLCGGVAGGVVAVKVSGGDRVIEALGVGTILTVGALLNVMTIPHPIWMSGASVAIQLPAAWLGARLAVRRAG
jgi:hypothetical protein